jgi:hypothetical protein
MGPTKWKGPTLERIRHQPYVAMREWRESTPSPNTKGKDAKRRSSLGLTVEVVVHPADIQDH